MSDYSSDPQGTFERARAGDTQAFLDLFESHKDRIKTHIRRNLRKVVLSRYDEDDVVQEVYVKGLSMRPKNRGVAETVAIESVRDLRERHFSWLLIIAVRASISLWRKNFKNQEPINHQQITGGRSPDSACIDVQASGTTPTKFLKRKERRHLINKAREKRDMWEQQMIDLKLADEPFAQIAAKLGMTVEAARKRWERLLKRLQIGRAHV